MTNHKVLAPQTPYRPLDVHCNDHSYGFMVMTIPCKGDLPMRLISCLLAALLLSGLADDHKLPDTGISGVYEVMVGVEDATAAIDYFAAFGFRVVTRVDLDAEVGRDIYGVDSALTAYRLQNGDVDAHGLLRILTGKHLLGPVSASPLRKPWVCAWR